MTIIHTQRSIMKLPLITIMKLIKPTSRATITRLHIITKWHMDTRSKRTVIMSMPRRSIPRLIATNTLSTVNTKFLSKLQPPSGGFSLIVFRPN